ncbi:MAG: bifunctional 5,10-methylenetetrahydrofolate dehydrogenase/5,10-methenyltetrahydrofolate cyclohydrolase [Clostridiales bacterium]|nr:bifunctional 5,10-methylenetetrahydrofolate dehydrogenase/5,10-methenyltetrahydrofolate cyclohydrolase [Clostridiales bacterium]
MTELLKGKAYIDSIIEELQKRSDALKEKDIVPLLAVVRMGEREDDLAYERGLKKRAVSAGVVVKVHMLPETADQKDVENLIGDLNADDKVHGILVFEPMPAHIDSEKVHKRLTPAKDVDGVTSGSMATVYSGTGKGFAPCTAEGCVELLKFYGVELAGKRVVVLGRSTVIGKPVSMLLLAENATVTICHSKTTDLPAICKEADILIACIGKGKFVGEQYLREGQVIVDVGINFDEEGNMTGDVDMEAAQSVGVAAITPVPGGVGMVTTAMLMKHVIESAER